MANNDVSLSDADAISTLINDWVVLRDAGYWNEFASVWHEDGWMTATWFQGPYREFIAVSREGFEKGVLISHSLGGHRSEIVGDRAIAQTKMKIEQRATVHGVGVDVTCSGRFFDFLERRGDRWGLVRRQPIYEWDRLDVIDPAATVELDPKRLSSLPIGYRHLGYVQESIGYKVMRDLPGLTGEAVEQLYEEGNAWLAGSVKPGTVSQRENLASSSTS